jgi:hypothetical protein
MLDVNGKAIGDGTLELLKFSETASAVNEFTVANSATGNAPVLSATGGDTNIDITLTPKGTGSINISKAAITSSITLKGITETEATSAASTYTVDLANGTIFEVTHATLCTVTMPTAAAGKSFTVISTVPAAWAGTIKWSGSAAPTGGVGISIYSFISNGTNWYGMRAGTNFG